MTKPRNEAETRAELIDTKLTAYGWQTGGKIRVYREYPITDGKLQAGGKRGKKLAADYALEYQGKILAIIEAKKESAYVTDGLEQAKNYAKRLQCRLAYTTNGKQIYQYDMLTGEQKKVANFLTPRELWKLVYQDNTNISAWRQRFADIPYATNNNQRPRYYQKNAIENVLDALMQGKNKILLTLATGTGKTFIACQLAYKLFQARWSKTARQDINQAKRQPRILFLADRNILADQAFNAFFPFAEDAKVRIDPGEIKKHGKVPKNAAIFFTIFQTFMSGKDVNGYPEPYFGDYPADFFDFIIIDECHRGGANDYSSWRQILDYFTPAVQLGLTATPKRKGNTDTYDYFGEPVYSYSLKDGINDGFLTPYKLLAITGTMDQYTYDPNDGVVVEGNPELGKLYTEADFNKTITIPQREQKRVQTWMNIFKSTDKTLVFCASQKHAAMVRDFINEYAYKKGWKTNEDYCVRVTADDGEIGEQFLRTFQDNEKTIPTILTTSRKLSTGVDARNVRNIVLMRPCKDMIEFKQIIGRGTRIYEDKSYFTIYDFVKAAENFNDPEWDGEPLPTPGIKPTTALPSKQCITCGQRPCICQPEDKVHVDLHEHVADEIKHTQAEAQWEYDGRLIGVTEVIEMLVADFASIVANKNDFCQQWQDYEQRQVLLDEFATKGYDADKLAAIKQHAKLQDCDIYDVLLYVGYNVTPISRQQRVANAQVNIKHKFSNDRQQQFINFVLEKYIADGEADLQLDKLSALITLKYKSIQDATNILQLNAEAIKNLFLTMQQVLYNN